LIFGIGTDIIEVARMEEKLLRTEGLKAEVFTPAEIAYCESKKYPAQHFAARFAAKEAFFKAMGTGWADGYRFAEIEVVNDPSGRPRLRVHGRVEGFCRDRGVAGMQVSLAHVKEYAKAVVVLETDAAGAHREE
jgi:holo-[acyl-carrier protein] synthase